MNAATLFGVAFVTMIVHLSLYRMLRGRLRTERRILAYHAFPALALIVFAVAAALHTDEETLAAAVAVVSGTGIYSLTFLELWTLSQISYSREVLLRARNGGLAVAPDSAVELAQVGEDKRAVRLASLSKMGLLSQRSDKWRLSRRGRVLAGLLAVLLWLTNLKARG